MECYGPAWRRSEKGGIGKFGVQLVEDVVDHNSQMYWITASPEKIDPPFNRVNSKAWYYGSDGIVFQDYILPVTVNPQVISQPE